MNLKSRLTGLLREGEIYGSQGLFQESLQKYREARQLIQETRGIKNRDSLLAVLSRKINTLEEAAQKVDQTPAEAQMSAQQQDLVKKLFAYSPDQDPDSIALEGALALAKFGQFKRALAEFREMLSKESLRLQAAKNIIRCHMAMSDGQEAGVEYGQWMQSGLFSRRQLEHLRAFLHNLMEQKGIDATLPQPSEDTPTTEPTVAADEIDEEEILDISSIVIHFDSGPYSGKQLELDVSFQTGNVISLLISSHEKEIIDNLTVGVKLENLQFFSPIAIFRGSGVISAKNKIDAGPKQGDYSLDIKIIGAE